MAEARSQPGWREVLLVATAVVAVVLGAAVLTSLMPADIQDAIFHRPILIAVLVGGTAWLLWRISRPRRPVPGPIDADATPHDDATRGPATDTDADPTPRP